MKALIAVVLLLTVGGMLADDYQEPDPTQFEIDVGKVAMNANEREELAESLVAYLRSLPPNRMLATAPKPMAVALFLAPENKAAVALNAQLRRGAFPDRVSAKRKDYMVKALVDRAKSLFKEKDDANRVLGGYLLDAALAIDPADQEASYGMELYTRKHGNPDWRKILKQSQRPQPERRPEAQPEFVAQPPPRPDGRPVISKGPVKGYERRPRDYAKKQATIKALMVTFEGNMMVGTTMDIIASVFQEGRPGTFGWGFARGGIGGEMLRACEEAVRLERTRYPMWENQTSVSFSFADKYTPKDGGSAGTAFALLLISLHDGIELDSDFAITGDITIDWKVRKIGGIPAKVKAAQAAGLKRVIVPEDNLDDVYDLVLLDGPDILWKIQVYSIKTLEEAVETARKDRTEARLEGEKTYESIQEYLEKRGTEGLTTKVYDALKQISKDSPNNVSAKILIEYREKKLEKRKLSLDTAIYAIIGSNYYALPIMERGDYKQIRQVPDSHLKESASLMKRIKPALPDELKTLHARVSTFSASLRDYKYYLDKNLTNTMQFQTLERALPQDARRLKDELEKLSRNDELLNKMMNARTQ